MQEAVDMSDVMSDVAYVRWLMSRSGQIRAFGFYLVICSIYQIALYMCSKGVASILDPRLGFFSLPSGEAWSTRMDWASAIWLFCVGLGLALSARRPLLMTYVLSECLFALPTVLYMVVSLAGGAGHLSATGAPLFILLTIVDGFTFIPLTLAMYLLWKKV